MPSTHLEYKQIFERIRDQFVQRISEEITAAQKKELLARGFNFIHQTRDIGSFILPLHITSHLQNYRKNLRELHDAVSQLNFDTHPIKFLEALDQLLKISAHDLFSHSVPFSYDEIYRHVSSYLASSTQRPSQPVVVQPVLSNEKRAIQRLRQRFPAINFQKMQQQFLSEIHREADPEERIQLSTNRRDILQLFIDDTEALDTSEDSDCYALVVKVNQYIDMQGSEKIVTENLGLNLTAATLPQTCTIYLRAFTDIFKGKIVPPIAQITEFLQPKTPAITEELLQKLRQAGFSLTILQMSLADMIEFYKTNVTRDLMSEKDSNKKSLLVEAGKKLSKLQQALASLHTSSIEDRYKICQLALYFIQENFAGMRGSRVIFSTARNQDQSKRDICHIEFAAIIPFVHAMVAPLLDATELGAQPVSSHSLFSPVTPPTSAQVEDEESHAPLERKSTGKPGDFKR